MKRTWRIICAAVCFLTCLSLPVSAQSDAVPAQISVSAQSSTIPAQISLDGQEVSAVLTDGALSTRVSFQQGQRLAVETAEPFAALYLIFQNEPAPYTVEGNGVTVEAGTHGFLHEVIMLPQTERRVEIVLPTGMLAELTVYGAGALPPEVQQWTPAEGKCDLLQFPTHSDDDTLYFGAAVAHAIAQGKSVQTAYLVHHRDTLERPHELLNGLWAMGATRYPVIGEFADYPSRALAHAYTLYDTEAMLAYQVEMLRRFKPDVTLGHDVYGEYGHGVHMLNTDLLCRAVMQSGDPDVFPESAEQHGVWQPSKTYLHLYPENVLTLDVHTPLPYYDGKTAYEVACDGFAQHHSQHIWDLAVTDTGESDCRLFGLYHTRVGPDTGADLFENIPQPAAIADESKTSSAEVKDMTSSSHAEEVSADVAESKAQPQQPAATPLLPVVWLCGAAVLVALLICAVLWYRRKRG